MLSEPCWGVLPWPWQEAWVSGRSPAREPAAYLSVVQHPCASFYHSRMYPSLYLLSASRTALPHQHLMGLQDMV